MSVNVSGRELTEFGLIECIEEILASQGVDARPLKPELTETAVIENREACQSAASKQRLSGLDFVADPESVHAKLRQTDLCEIVVRHAGELDQCAP